MTIIVFLELLSVFTVLNSIIVEASKKVLENRKVSYNLVAVISGLIVGFFGNLAYYELSGIGFAHSAILISIIMGLAIALTSMVGYDKIKQLVEQLTLK